MPSPNFTHRLLAPVAMLLALSGCAPYARILRGFLQWQDPWGDRGKQVLVRDYAMCEALVEQRRSLLDGCLAARGWNVRE